MRVVKGGNNLVDGEINEETLKKTLKKISKRGFCNKYPQSEISEDEIKLVNQEFSLNMPYRWSVEISRELYAKTYGPTTGDRIHLGDLNLVIEIEKDFCNYGDELTFGVGKVKFEYYCS